MGNIRTGRLFFLYRCSKQGRVPHRAFEDWDTLPRQKINSLRRSLTLSTTSALTPFTQSSDLVSSWGEAKTLPRPPFSLYSLEETNTVSRKPVLPYERGKGKRKEPWRQRESRDGFIFPNVQTIKDREPRHDLFFVSSSDTLLLSSSIDPKGFSILSLTIPRKAEVISSASVASIQNWSLSLYCSRLCSLVHPNLHGYTNYTRTKKWIRVVTPYNSGATLHFLMKQFRFFSASVVSRYVRDVLSGLAFLHRHRFAHQNITPKNILVNAAGICTLCLYGFPPRVLLRCLPVRGRKNGFRPLSTVSLPRATKRREMRREK